MLEGCLRTIETCNLDGREEAELETEVEHICAATRPQCPAGEQCLCTALGRWRWEGRLSSFHPWKAAETKAGTIRDKIVTLLNFVSELTLPITSHDGPFSSFFWLHDILVL